MDVSKLKDCCLGHVDKSFLCNNGLGVHNYTDVTPKWRMKKWNQIVMILLAVNLTCCYLTVYPGILSTITG